MLLRKFTDGQVQLATVGETMSELLSAQQVGLERTGADPHGYIERVRLHLQDLKALHDSKDRRRGRNVLDRLVRTRFVQSGGQCLCTADAQLLRNAGRFDGWVHAHHTELMAQLTALFSLDERRALFTTAERYQTDIGAAKTAQASTVEELRVVQDWLFEPFESELQRRSRGKAKNPSSSGA